MRGGVREAEGWHTYAMLKKGVENERLKAVDLGDQLSRIETQFSIFAQISSIQPYLAYALLLLQPKSAD